MSTNQRKISALIVCFNEEKNIRDCLESLKWCDEIVVVDSYSTDRTVEICRQFTDRVIQREWTGYRSQKAYAHSQATKEWVGLTGTGYLGSLKVNANDVKASVSWASTSVMFQPGGPR
mgnify:CR=1 FL=1